MQKLKSIKRFFPCFEECLPSIEKQLVFCDSNSQGQADILMLHGGGAVSGLHHYNALRKDLYNFGISSCTFDFIGHGQSKGMLYDSSLAQRTEEAYEVAMSGRLKHPMTINGVMSIIYKAYVEFLRRCMKVFLIMVCLVSMLFTTPTIFAENNPKIVVIGAGLAGLTIAYRLKTAGMDVDLYEARNRVGGRVLTAKLNNQIVELGAHTFTNPSKHPHLCRLIQEFALEIVDNIAALSCLYFDGENFIPITQLLEKFPLDPSTLHNKLIELSATSSNMKEVLEQLLGQKNPLFKIMAIKLAIYEGAPPESLSTQYVETLSYFFSEAISLQTKKYADHYINRSSIKGGNGILPEKIASHLGPRLNLNKCLTQVSRSNTNSFTLTFNNDQKVQADVLVLAVPCSVYKDIDFEETVISSDKIKIINAVKYGTNSKIAVYFYNTMEKTLGLVSDQIYGNFDSCHGILTMNFTDEIAENLEEKFVNIYSLARPMIENKFDSFSFNFPLNAKDQNFAIYNSSIGYSWINDPFSKGSYSYISPGQENILTSITEENGEKFKTLFVPIQDLYFAGEHASISEIPGTMEAACESGERIVRTILRKYKNFGSQ